jgi:uncharacterized protein RhaS with RHS repeats
MIGRLERRKDTIQLALESAFSHVGQIATIVADAGREVTREVGEWATDLFEIREAARRAGADEERHGVVSGEPEAESITARSATGATHELRRPLRRP